MIVDDLGALNQVNAILRSLLIKRSFYRREPAVINEFDCQEDMETVAVNIINYITKFLHVT